MEFEEKKMIYEGNFVNGAMFDKGKMVFSNGMIYEGEWNEDCFCGEGILNLNDGRLIKGIWMESSLIDGDMIVGTVF